MSKRMLGVAVLVLALAAGNAFGFSVTSGDRDLGGGANLVNDGATETITPTGTTGFPADPFVYDWDDIDGAGTDASDNLVLGGSKLHNSDGSCFALKLGNANGKGTVTGTGAKAIETVDAWVTGRPERTGGGWFSGDVSITKVGDVSMGGIVTSSIAGGSVYGWAGDVLIGESGDRAGNVRIDYVDTHGQGAGLRAGDFTVYSNGDVKLETSGGAAGDLLGYATSGNGSSIINIQHDGAFKARDIQDYLGGAWTGNERIGTFTAEGDVVGDGASGTFEVRDINQYFTYWSYRKNVGAVDISGYTGVVIAGGIDTHSIATGSTTAKYASDVTIEDIEGDIVIVGAIDLQGNTGGTPPDPQYNGVLTLQTIASTITLGDEANPGAEELDLGKVKYILFDSDSGVSWIWHDIDNWVQGSDTLRVAEAGDVVYYSRGANPDLLTGGPLGDGVYPLTGGGINGTLEPTPLPIPEPAGLSLLGLAILGLRRKRS